MKLVHLVPTLESIEEMPIETPVIDETENPVVEATEATADLEEQIQEAEGIELTIDEATGAVDTLTETQDQVQSQIDAGKVLTETECKLIEATHESIMNSLGIKYEVPSLESMTYSDRSQKVITTLESSSDGIFAKIGQAIKHAVEAVINFIKNLVRNTWVLEKYLKHVEVKVQAIKGKAFDDRMHESGKALSHNGVSDENSRKAIYDTALALLDLSSKAADEVNKLNFKFDTKESDTDEFRNLLVNEKTIGIKGARLSHKDNTFGALTGDRTIVGSREWFVSGAYKEIAAYPEPETYTDVPDKKQMEVALGQAKNIIAELKKFDSKSSMIKNGASRILQYLVEDVTTTASIVSKAAKERAYAMRMGRSYRRILTSITGRLPLESFKAAKALIDYARHGLKYYK